MTDSTKLVITDISPNQRQAFLNMADTLELTRGQMFALLLVGAEIVSGGLDQVIPNIEAQGEWRDLMVQRTFDLSRL